MKTKKRYLGLFLLLCLSFFAIFSPASGLTNPTVHSSNASTGQTATAITVSLGTLASDSLVVIEWAGPFSNCTFIQTPTDSNANTWVAIGSCIDGNGGPMEAFKVASNSATATDTVTCNFVTGTFAEACYAFDVNNPGAITLLASAMGSSNTMKTTPAAASSNALLLQTAGLQYYCQSLVGGFDFQQYIPSSDCTTFFTSLYGLAGGYTLIPTGGATTSSQMVAGQVMVWSELVVQIAAATPASSTSTSYTATIVGWLTPDSAHFANTYILIIFPLIGLVIGLLPFTMFQRNEEIGDKAILPALFGLLVGAIAADLSVSPTIQFQVPFAFIVVIAMLIFLYWWNQ